jgi:hypothetical protein
MREEKLVIIRCGATKEICDIIEVRDVPPAGWSIDSITPMGGTGTSKEEFATFAAVVKLVRRSDSDLVPNPPNAPTPRLAEAIR